MTASDQTPHALAELADRLMSRYPSASPEEVLMCVQHARDAVEFVGAADDREVAAVAEQIAERDLRLRLGLDREAARLDPERHERS